MIVYCRPPEESVKFRHLIAVVRTDMRMKWAMGLMVLLSVSCVHTDVPGYIRHSEGTRILLPDKNLSCVLSAEESKALVNAFDGRLFANGRRMTEADRRDRKPVLAVAYPYPTGETHIHVYPDGMAGYLRTMRTYEVYPMRKYCAEAIDLAVKHGLMPGKDSANHGTEPIR